VGATKSLDLYGLLQKQGCTLERVFVLDWESEFQTEVFLLDFQTSFAYVCLKQGPKVCYVIAALKPKYDREVCSAFFGGCLAGDGRIGTSFLHSLPSLICNWHRRLVPEEVIRDRFQHWIEDHYRGRWIDFRDDVVALLRATPEDKSCELEGFRPLIHKLVSIKGHANKVLSDADKESILDTYFSTYYEEAKNVWLGHITTPDPRVGIKWENITSELGESNWARKAVVRFDDISYLYLWVTKVELHYGYSKERITNYSVHVHAPEFNKWGKRYERYFPELPQALAYVNGCDGGRLAIESRPATTFEYPTQHEAPWTICVGGFRGGRR